MLTSLDVVILLYTHCNFTNNVHFKVFLIAASESRFKRMFVHAQDDSPPHPQASGLTSLIHFVRGPQGPRNTS